jgi:hypothetical protein
VRSYRTFSPLLAVAAYAAMAQQASRACRAEAPEGEGGRFVLCGTVPGAFPACAKEKPRRMLSGTVCRWSPDFPLP